MEKFNNITHELFSSLYGQFRLSTEIYLTSKQDNGSIKDLVYTTQNGYCAINPKIFLSMSFRPQGISKPTKDETIGVYLTVSHMGALRSMFNTFVQSLYDGSAYTIVNNELAMNPEFDNDNFRIMNIGKNNRAVICQMGLSKSEGDSNDIIPVLTIRYSENDSRMSVLTEREICAVSEVLNNLDLTNEGYIAALTYMLMNSSTQPAASYQNSGVVERSSYANSPSRYTSGKTTSTPAANSSGVIVRSFGDASAQTKKAAPTSYASSPMTPRKSTAVISKKSMKDAIAESERNIPEESISLSNIEDDIDHMLDCE